MQRRHSPSLGVFKLLMIAIISVDSIRNLAINAQYGLPLVTLFIIGGIGFFLPLLRVTNFLATHYPITGGAYVWIEKAFGHRWGILSIWLQWVYNMIWYPTIFAFISATIGALLSPSLQRSGPFILICSLVLFWGITLLCCHGVRAISLMSAIGSVLGTLLPMVFLIGLALVYLASGHPSATPMKWNDLLPTQSTFANLGFFANILFSLLGIDVIAMHGGDVQKPARTYPRVLSIAGTIILASLILSSFAICVIIPPDQIGLVDGLIQAFDLFTKAYNIRWAHTLICLSIVLGGLGIVTSWMSGLARGLHIAALSIRVPKLLEKVNASGMPYPILIGQAIIFSLLLSVFLIFPNINSSYWLFSSMTAQFAMLYYLVLFIAAGFLAMQKQLFSSYAPFIGLAIATTLVGFGVGFLPPSSVISKAQIFHYEMVLIFGGLAFLSPLVFLFYARRRK